MHAFASANSHMLSNLADASKPVRECRGRVLALSGMTSTLAFTTSSTLRGGLDAPWDELLAASRSIRGLAAETLRLARAAGLELDLQAAAGGQAERSGGERVASASHCLARPARDSDWARALVQ